jgi:prepilin-type N-terminal cleavage/methylation domain-containing protein
MIRASGRPQGFTLLELMAVVAVIALIVGLVLPGLGATRSALLRSQAREIAALLELARQRAVITGKPHRVLIGVDEGMFRLDWFASENETLGLEPGSEPPPLDLSGDSPIPLSPPLDRSLDYRPVPGRFGRDRWLGEGFAFEGVDTPEGWLDQGDVAVVFQRDGTTDAAEIAIVDRDQRRIFLELRPLVERVRIRDEES